MKTPKNVLAVLLFLGLIFSTGGKRVLAQNESKLSFNSHISMVSGNYLYEHDRSFYLYGGLNYKTGSLNFSASVPLVLTTSGTVSQIGGTYYQTHDNPHDEETNSPDDDHSHMGGAHGGFLDEYDTGLGDLYFNSHFTLVEQGRVTPQLKVSSYLKFPTASSHLNIGTGEFDYNVSASLSKTVDTYSFYFSVGKLFLGDTEEFQFNDPFIFSGSIGKYFPKKDFSVLINYERYTPIFPDTQAPAQLSVGINLPGSMMNYNLIGSLGLSETSPDFTISCGMNMML